MQDIVKDSYTLMLGDCLERMKELPDGSVDLVLTSPPYDSIRTYNDSLMWSFEIFEAAAREIYRVLAPGGVCVWVVGDATHAGSETGTSFRQALYFKGLGLNLHDTMIYAKTKPVPLTHNRYEQQFEYMFILSKGRPKTFNGLREPCKRAGEKNHTIHRRKGEDLERGSGFGRPVKDTRLRYNIWYYATSQPGRDYRHPAVFPLELAQDHVASWSNPGDLVLDPFLGSGTSGEAALRLGRQFVGVEKEPSYFEMAANRLAALPAQSDGTTSEQQQTPADPDDSAPSAHSVSAVPGNC